ncbi:MAG: DMT family transporter [Caldisericia bacterium]|nr:DMT family transporter [Caldisericia bacterium]
MNSENKIALIANILLMIAVVSWGLSFVSMKVILSAGIPPMTMCTIRYGIVAVVFVAVLLLAKKQEKQLTVKDHLLLLASGFFGITLYFWFEARAIVFTTASNAAIIIALVPIVTHIVDVLWLKNRTTAWQNIGILLSFVGVYFIVFYNVNFKNVSSTLKGNLLMIGAVICWVSFTLIGKIVQKRVDPVRTTSWQSIYGTLLLIPFAFSEKLSWVAIKPNLWIHFIYLAVFCSILAYLIYNSALKKIGVTVVSTYVNVVPVVGVIGGTMLLNETMTSTQFIGVAIVVLSLFMVNIKKEKQILDKL